MRLFNTIALIFLCTSCVHSEIIDGPANVRDLRINEVLISLFDGMVQDAARIDEKYFELEIWGISKTETDNDFITLSRGDTIYSLVHDGYPPDLENTNTIPIGVVINNFNANIYGKTDSSHVIWYFHCKTYKENFKRNSVPELDLEFILQNKSVSDDLIEKHIEHFGYKENEWVDDLIEGFKNFHLDDNTIKDPSPIMRMTISFKQGKLAAIASANGLYGIDWDVRKISRSFRIYFAPYLSVSDRNYYLEKYDKLLNSID